MARHGMHLLFQQAGWLANGPQAGDPTDGALLNVCVNDGDTAGMDALVRRHGPMVWATCKQMLPDPSEAEDAFQATFLVLVQSAKKLRSLKSLGGWLHGVAVKVCWKQRRGAVRRKQRDTKSAKPEASTPRAEPAWDGLYSAVHDEVEKLPATLRTAFVLCELQGQRPGDAATQLGWKIGTLSGRLTRARQQLMKKLTARGFAPLVVVAATATTAAQAAMPLGEALLSAGAVIHHPANLLPSTVLGLAKAITGGVTMKMKLVLASGVLITGLTVGLGWKYGNDASAQTGSAIGPPPATTKPAEKPKPKPMPVADPSVPAGSADPKPASLPPSGIPVGGPPGIAGGPGGMFAGGALPTATVPDADWSAKTKPVPSVSRVEHTMTDIPANKQKLQDMLVSMGEMGWTFSAQVTLGDKDSKLVFSKAAKAQTPAVVTSLPVGAPFNTSEGAGDVGSSYVYRSQDVFNPKTNVTTRNWYYEPLKTAINPMTESPAAVPATTLPTNTSYPARAGGGSSTLSAPTTKTGSLNNDGKSKPRIEVIKPKEGANLSSLKEVAMAVFGAVAKEEGAEPTGQESVLITDTGYLIITGASPKAFELLRQVLEKIEK